MDVGTFIRIIQRRIVLIISVVLVTVLVMIVRIRSTQPVYEAQIKLQLTAPEREDVMLYERYRAIDARDELTVMRNNFVELLQSREITKRTIKQLNLDDDTEYAVSVRPIRDADFVYVVVGARTAELAEMIANTHVDMAIRYFGEIRAQPTTATKNFLAQELRVAKEKLQIAEEAFNEFKIRNNITTMDAEVSIYQGLIDKLQAERNQRMIQGATSWEIQSKEMLIEQLNLERERAVAVADDVGVGRFDQAIARHREELQKLREATSPTASIDSIITKRREELARLLVFRPTYERLENEALQASKEHELLLNKYTEASLKENTVKQASAIQLIEPAVAPSQPAPTKQTTMLALALVGSLSIGIMLAFALESLTGFRFTIPVVVSQRHSRISKLLQQFARSPKVILAAEETQDLTDTVSQNGNGNPSKRRFRRSPVRTKQP
jgi:uncharacterized protein involved in exopolysaccharide biosynthesis